MPRGRGNRPAEGRHFGFHRALRRLDGGEHVHHPMPVYDAARQLLAQLAGADRSQPLSQPRSL